MARKLTHKQKLFVEYYLQSWNATLAAEQAEYKGNRKTLGSVGTENLAKPAIKAHIEERLSETVMTSNEVLSRLGNMARSFDMTKYIALKERYEIVTKTVDGKEKHYKEFAGYVVSFDLDKLQEDGFSHLVKKIKQTNAGGIEVEWHDQMAALVHLGKHHQLFTDKLKIEHVDWRTEAITLIKEGKLTYPGLTVEIGESLAKELFDTAGIAIAE